MVQSPDQSSPDKTLELWRGLPARSWQTTFALMMAFVIVWILVYFGLGGLAGARPTMLVSLALLVLLSALTAYDLRLRILPDYLTVSLVGFGLFWNFWQYEKAILPVIGAALGFSIFWMLDVFWRSRTGRTGLGRGDAKLLAGAGAVLGPVQLPFVILISSAAALGFVLLVSLISRKISADRLVAFGPYICTAIWCLWCVQ